MTQKWPKKGSKSDPKRGQKWPLFGSLFGPSFEGLWLILRDLAYYLAYPVKEGLKKGPKSDPKKGQNMTQKEVKNDPKKGQKVTQKEVIFDLFFDLFLTTILGWFRVVLAPSIRSGLTPIPSMY
jgi:hypothetical protein